MRILRPRGWAGRLRLQLSAALASGVRREQVQPLAHPTPFLGGTAMALSENTKNLLLLISRALIALLFIPVGLNAITGFEGTVRYITSNHVPYPEIDAVIAILVEVGLAFLLLIGYQTRWVALGIIIFIVVITFLFHPYWAVPAAQLTAQKNNFFKNFAIVGGLCAILATGAGGWSIDGRRGTPRRRA
jgi:putative oxidoreductase